MSEAQEKTQGLVRKLCEVMASISTVAKKGHNKFHNYAYATEADLVEAVRGELSKRSLFVFPSVISHSRNGELTDIMVRWTFVDGETGETHECMIPGCGQDKGDKGVYKALTGSEKYLLMKAFLIPTGDDPEKEDGSDRAEGIKAAKAVATEKLRSHARTNGGSELVTISPYKEGFYALSGPGVSIIRANMDNAMRSKFGWKQEGNVHMFVKEHKARMIAFCTEHQISVLDESAGAPIANESRPTPGVTVEDMAAKFGGTPTPFSDDPSTDPLIMDANIKKGKKGEFLVVKWNGHDISCFDSKVFSDILANVKKPAMLDWSSTPKGYKNLLHIVRLDGQKYTPPAKTYSAQDSDVPF